MEEYTAKGTFEVKLTPASDAAAPVGRMTIAKTFRGDIDGTSTGEMLAIGTSIKDSAGYVAMERVTAEVRGKRGTFALQHNGSMNRGAPSLTVTVVPDSGTEALVGISGTLQIKIEDGKHLYTFNYSLPK